MSDGNANGVVAAAAARAQELEIENLRLQREVAALKEHLAWMHQKLERVSAIIVNASDQVKVAMRGL